MVVENIIFFCLCDLTGNDEKFAVVVVRQLSNEEEFNGVCLLKKFCSLKPVPCFAY